MAATTNGMNGVKHKSRFPEIVLDRTLADLLAEEHGDDRLEAVCNMKPCADPAYKAPPVNKKHLLTSLPAPNEDDLATLQLISVPFLLTFWADPLEMPMMGCEGFSDDATLTKEAIEHDAKIAVSVLTEKQRPRPRVFKNKDDYVQHYQNSKKPIRWSFALDFAAEMPHYIHPTKHYKLNSKRWLAECELRSANDRIIDPECSCSTHKTRDGYWYYGSDCSECKEAVEKEMARLSDILKERKLPFVLKITQSAGAVGTMIVKDDDEEKRNSTIEKITGIQKDVLPRVTEENASIHPASLILSDLLPGETATLNFFIRKNGNVQFLGAGEQLGTRETTGQAQHSGLIYSRQEELEKKFRATLDKIGKVLHAEGYFGPCGADVMEAEDGTQYVIDLNVRTSTSTALACIKTHCADRNFDCSAVYETMFLTLPRDKLLDKFEKDFQDGRFIIMGTTKLGGKDVWAYPVILAGENLDAVHELQERIQEFDASKDLQETAEAGGT